ncbi:PAS domain-containing protein [Candidatus Omnitrophota bacterium]
MSEERKTEKELIEEIRLLKEEFKNIMFLIPSVTYKSKPSGDYAATYISDNVKRITGYEPKDFIGNSSFWIDNVHPEDRQCVLGDLPMLLKNNYCRHEYRFRKKDGSWLWMHDEMHVVRDKEGSPTEIIGSWLDITARKKVEQALQETQAQLVQSEKIKTFSTTALGVAHEVLNPLAVIRQGIDSLKREAPKDNKDIDSALKLISEHIDRLDKIIKALLNLAKRTNVDLKSEYVDSTLKIWLDKEN